jgi:cysteine desulfurase
MSVVYVDHAATSQPVLFPVANQPSWANASAGHRHGRASRAALNEARRRVAAALGLEPRATATAEDRVLFTSGGTEGNNLVVLQQRWRFVITLATEHHAVGLAVEALRNRCPVVYLEVDGTGRVAHPEQLRALLAEPRFAEQPGLVSVAYVNNETGAVQDLAALGRIVQDANRTRTLGNALCFHSDAVQGPGHVPVGMPGGACATPPRRRGPTDRWPRSIWSPSRRTSSTARPAWGCWCRARCRCAPFCRSR